MNKYVGRAVALLLAVTLCFCLAACSRGGEDEPSTIEYSTVPNEESTTTPEESSSTTGSFTTPVEITDKEGNTLVTKLLVTQLGVTVPTVATSQWSTALPPETIVASVTETTTTFIIPGNIDAPSMNTTIAQTTAPSTESTSTTLGSSGSSETTTTTVAPSQDSGTTTNATPSAATTSPDNTTTEPAVKVAKTLEYYCHSISNGDLMIDFDASGWKNAETIKGNSKNVTVTIGDTTYENIRCTVSEGVNDDGRIEVKLDTSKINVDPDQTVCFTIPEKLICTNDGSYYNSAYTATVH